MDGEHEELEELEAQADQGETARESGGWPVPDVPPGPVGAANQVWPADDGAASRGSGVRRFRGGQPGASRRGDARPGHERAD
jgi:hypothetical protein